MKKFLAILCLICALCATLAFAGCDYSWQPPDYPDYVVDESGHHIANIDRAAFAGCRILREAAGEINFAAGIMDDNIIVTRFLGSDIIVLKDTVNAVWDRLRRALLDKPAVKIRKF